MASRAAASVVVVLARPERLVDRVGYITSPGRNVESIATDLGVLRRHDGVLRVEAVAAGEASAEERVKRFASGCGWDVEVARELEELPATDQSDVAGSSPLRPRGAVPS